MLHVTMATIWVLAAQAAVMCFNIETIIHDVSALLSILEYLSVKLTVYSLRLKQMILSTPHCHSAPVICAVHTVVVAK